MPTRSNNSRTRRMFRFAVMGALAFVNASDVHGQSFYPPMVESVGNSASYYTSDLPGYGIAQGSLIVVFGWMMGPNQLVQNSGFPLPLDLGGTSIKLTVAGGTRSLPMVYTSYEQVAAIVPSATPAGTGTLVLTYRGQASDPVRVNVVASAFGIYSARSSGFGSGIVTATDYRMKTLADSFRPNDQAILWGTGLGPIPADDGAAPPLAANLPGAEVFVGNQQATVLYAGRSGCCAGLDQINIVIPAGVEGCFVPVAVRTGSVTSNFVTIPLAAAGGACSDPVGVPSTLVRSAQSGRPVNVGAIALGSYPVLQAVGVRYSSALAASLSATLRLKVTEKDVRAMIAATPAHRRAMLLALVRKSTPTSTERLRRLREVARLARGFDQQGAAGLFGQVSSVAEIITGYGQVLPSAGSCSVYSESIGDTENWRARKQGLDAGPELILSGPLGTRSLARQGNGLYQISFGGGFAAGHLPSGQYTVTSAGGGDVGAFSASLTVAGDLRWANKADKAFVDRTAPFEVTWTGGPAAGYVVFGGSAGAAGRLYRVFACVEDVRTGRLSVPPFVLRALPPTGFGKLFLGPHPLQNSFSARGLDAAYIADLSTDNRDIEFR